MAKIGILHGKLLIVIPIKQLLLGILPNDEENSFQQMIGNKVMNKL